ncbi:hypothetical protein QTP70_005632 [Hemibagrus guttatus]|uniref:Integrase catalytic domain-containing protein n=1 Tax=Hemibagrus guttatus TaxID=175788 RepID=A0AAE0VDU7_9TELE|nr:hypothetical protein QTP70_005632 [Hemibagrus guttatus]
MDLPDSEGHTTVLVVVNHFSKGCKLIPLKGLPSAMQTAEALFLHVFRNFGLPKDIVSDRGSQFTSRVWGSLCARLGIRVSLSSGYHPQSNGQAERLNQEIGRFLRSYCSREQYRWSEFLPWAEYAQNSLTHSSTGLTSFQCVLGYQLPLFPWSGEPSDVPAVEEWYQQSQEVGQKVWLSTRNLCLKLLCRKLSPRFISPFEIIRQVNPVAYRLWLPATYRICPMFHVSLLKPAHPSTEGAPAGREPPPPLDVEGSPAYQYENAPVSFKKAWFSKVTVEELKWPANNPDLIPTSLWDELEHHTPELSGKPSQKSGGCYGSGGCYNGMFDSQLTLKLEADWSAAVLPVR